ncbi:MAG TPA: hypothetical protein VGL88_07785 [Pseudonocardiaceae bacterium]
MSLTPIYDQLRGERLNAEVPATGAEPHPVNPGQPFPVDATAHAVAGSASVFERPPGPGTDPLNHTYPVGLEQLA